MDSAPGTRTHSFNVYLSADLKARIDDISAILGIPQCRFVEMAARLYAHQLNQTDGYLFPPATPLPFLQNLCRKQPSRRQ